MNVLTIPEAPGVYLPTGTAWDSRDISATRGRLMGMKPGDTIGAYKLGQILGRGGMASVFRAFHETDGTPVALKVLHPKIACQDALVEILMRLCSDCKRRGDADLQRFRGPHR